MVNCLFTIDYTHTLSQRVMGLVLMVSTFTELVAGNISLPAAFKAIYAIPT